MDDDFAARLAAAWTPTDPAELRKRYWRWWTVFGWWNDKDRGLKLGPVTIWLYRWDCWEFGCFVLGRFGIDSGVIRNGGLWVIR